MTERTTATHTHTADKKLYSAEHEQANKDYLIRSGHMYDYNKLAEVNYIIGCQNRTTELLLSDPRLDGKIREAVEALAKGQLYVRQLIHENLNPIAEGLDNAS